MPWEIHGIMEHAGNLDSPLVDSAKNRVSPSEAYPAAGVEIIAETPAFRRLSHLLKGRPDGPDLSVGLFPPPPFGSVRVDRIQVAKGEFRKSHPHDSARMAF